MPCLLAVSRQHSPQMLDVELDGSNIVVHVPHAGTIPALRLLCEGDVIVGVNLQPLLPVALSCSWPHTTHHVVPQSNEQTSPRWSIQEVLANAGVDNAAASVLTIMRPKARVPLRGASISVGGPRKGGGHYLTVAPSEGAAKRARYVLVAGSEAEAKDWVAAMHEAAAAGAVAKVKLAIQDALVGVRDAPEKIASTNDGGGIVDVLWRDEK
eukprot:scaffold192564_cov35-Tisochrysis_lutea.AAC.1